MGTSIYNIGVSGINAAQVGLATTGHNISNATTPGFNRQQAIQSTNTPQFTGAGFIGQGTNVATIKRVYNEYLANQVQSTQTRLSEVDTYYSEIKQIDNMLANQSAGLSSALNEFFTGTNQVASNPASVSARQVMLSSSQALVGRFQSIDNRLNEIRNGINTQITSTVSGINSYATQIAEMNQRIVVAQASGSNQAPNDLLDQRDQLISDLNKLVRVSTVSQTDGTLNVFVGNGQPLVVNIQSFVFGAMPSPTDSTRLTVGMILPGGPLAAIPEAQLNGGTLGGLLSFRSNSLDTTQNAIGRVALGFATTFNDQHRLGQDLNGLAGANFFTAPVPRVINANNPANAGTATIGAAVANVANITTSDYTLTANGGGNFTLTRLSDNTNLFTATTLPQTVDGLTISLTAGAAVAGDTFLIQPTRNAANTIAVALTDPRGIAAAAPIRTAASLANTSTAKISAGTVNPPAPQNVNLTQAVNITFNNPPTTFNVTGTGTGNPINVAYTAGSNITYNGWTMQISGTPAAGDVFNVSANASGVADNRNALLLSGLNSVSTLVGGTTTYQGAYAQVVSDVGNKTREMEVMSAAQTNMLKQAQDAQQSLSGVNLDEEAANLLRYQQAYQASGKMIEIASKLFDTLLGLGR